MNGINTSTLKLPPKRKIVVPKSAIHEKTQEVHEKKLGEMASKGWSGNVYLDEPNNSFLWLLALMPFFHLALHHLFIVFPFGSDAMYYGSKEVFEKLNTATIIFAVGMNTIFAGLDVYELSRRARNTSGNSFMAVLAFCLVPIYLLFGRGKPSSCLLPYSIWWIGFLILLKVGSVSAMALVMWGIIALLFGLITLFVYKEKNEVAPETNTLKQEEDKSTDINETLGI